MKFLGQITICRQFPKIIPSMTGNYLPLVSRHQNDRSKMFKSNSVHHRLLIYSTWPPECPIRSPRLPCRAGRPHKSTGRARPAICSDVTFGTKLTHDHWSGPACSLQSSPGNSSCPRQHCPWSEYAASGTRPRGSGAPGACSAG